jgi:hypothetical protein
VLDGVARPDEVERCRQVAKQEECEFVVVLAECADLQLNHERIRHRVRSIPGWCELTWEDVERTRTTWSPPDHVDLTLQATEGTVALRANDGDLASFGAMPERQLRGAHVFSMHLNTGLSASLLPPRVATPQCNSALGLRHEIGQWIDGGEPPIDENRFPHESVYWLILPIDDEPGLTFDARMLRLPTIDLFYKIGNYPSWGGPGQDWTLVDHTGFESFDGGVHYPARKRAHYSAHSQGYIRLPGDCGDTSA